MSRKPLSGIITSLVIFMICLAVFTACESNTIPSGSFYVTTTKTSFYKFGPAQSFGPDYTLDSGARVTMLEHSYGYSRVMTADGTAGYVATDDLRPDLTVYKTARGTKIDYTAQMKRPMFEQPQSTEKHSNVPPTKGGSPLFDTGDNPLPAGTPPPSTLPAFKY